MLTGLSKLAALARSLLTFSSPPVPYSWKVYSASTEADVGSAFTTTGPTAQEVFHEATHSANGSAALIADSGFALGDNEAYDGDGAHLAIFNQGNTMFAAGATIYTNGLKFNGSSTPYNLLRFRINGGGTRYVGVYLVSGP